MGELDGVTIAFDLDNTLLDPSGARYEAVTSEFLARCDLGLDAPTARDGYERVRRWGPVLARLRLANPLHDRGHVDGLATLALLFGTKGDYAPVAGESRGEFIALLDALEQAAGRTSVGSPRARLEAERSLRSLVDCETAADLHSAVRALSKRPTFLKWSAAYEAMEGAHPVEEVCPMVKDLARRGAACAVISQGQSVFQRPKLERLGLARWVFGRMLITEDARRVADCEALDARLEPLLAGDDDGAELFDLWNYRCLLDLWGSKSPWFYARCLHALHGGGGNVERRFISLTTVSTNDWSENLPRFVMIGDRYENDIRPLIDLLGCESATTIHLRTGKFNQHFDDRELPEFTRPTYSFKTFSDLRAFLGNSLMASGVSTIDRPPPIAPPGWFDEQTLAFGAQSDLECVRKITEAVRATQSS